MYRTVEELTREELEELKQDYYLNEINGNASYGELAAIDDLVTDADIFVAFAGVEFVEEDFYYNL